MRSMLRLALLAVLIGMTPSVDAPVMAMATGGDTPAKAKDADLAAAETAIKAKDYRGAIPLLEKAIARDSKNADAYNLLGYSHRNLGDKDKALAAYSQALQIDANHRGANEYLGELYLMMDDLPKAEERLARLSSICTFGCAEHRELRAAIDAYKAKRPKT